MQIRPPKPLPMLRLDQLGALHGTTDQVKRTGLGMSDDTKVALKRLDLTRIRPSEFNAIAVRLREEGKLTEDVVSNLILFRASGWRSMADDRPFDLIKEAEDMARIVRSASPMSQIASQRIGLEGALYSAKGLAKFIKTYQIGAGFDGHA